MNCPQHLREIKDPEALKNEKELEEIKEDEYLLTGPHFGEDCNS
jgi:hypothetical protein